MYVHVHLNTPALAPVWTALPSDNVNEDKLASFVVKQPGSSFNSKMHLGHGGGWRLKTSASYGESQRAKRVRYRDGRQASGGKAGAAGLDWFANF